MDDHRSNDACHGRGHWWLAAALGFAAGIGGMLLVSGQPAEAQVRRSPAPKAFLSGGERSERVLVEISATLLRMEAQLLEIRKAMRVEKE